MKKLIVFFLSLFIIATGFSQVKRASDVVSFPIVKHDFGKIKQGVPVNYGFDFKNTGKAPVVIESATASCGCTTPAWPKTPVLQGKTDKITAGFNAAAPGPFNKSIQVKVAGFDLPLELVITGEVLSPADYVKYQATQNKSSR